MLKELKMYSGVQREKTCLFNMT